VVREPIDKTRELRSTKKRKQYTLREPYLLLKKHNTYSPEIVSLSESTSYPGTGGRKRDTWGIFWVFKLFLGAKT
jgi:hypothetical protein